MCIRDSVWAGYGMLIAIAGTFLVPGLKNIALMALALVIGAVSYTHLRAHETVLDFVCRLLLEKKKITKE